MFIVGKCIHAEIVVIVPVEQSVCTTETDFLKSESKERMRKIRQKLHESKQIVEHDGDNVTIDGAPPEIAEHFREMIVERAKQFISEYGNTIDKIHDVSQVKLSARLQDDWYCFIDYELCATFAEALACSKAIQS